MSKYPAQIDNSTTLPLVTDNSTPVAADTVNRLRNAIIAIESELGVKPAGIYSTVRARLDNLENLLNLDVIALAGDLGGTTTSPLVIGLQGNPISTTDPLNNQVLTWNGVAWIPETPTNILINVLPTAILLPAEINFLCGDGYNGISSPVRVGARVIDFSFYPASYTDGRIRTLKFKADLEVTNTSADGYVQLKDVTHNVIILNTLLTTKSLSSVELSVVINTGTTDGYMRTDSNAMYEVQIYIANGGLTDQVICRNARVEVTYSPPILVTALVPLALPVDLQFVAGTTLNGFTTPAGIGGRTIDMINFPTTLPDGRARFFNFYADVEVSTAGVDGYVQLFDTTHNILVTNTQFHFTNTIAAEVSTSLTIGTGAGNIRTDVVSRYEVRIWKVSGSVADRVICNNARVVVTYA